MATIKRGYDWIKKEDTTENKGENYRTFITDNPVMEDNGYSFVFSSFYNFLVGSIFHFLKDDIEYRVVCRRGRRTHIAERVDGCRMSARDVINFRRGNIIFKTGHLYE